MQETIIIVGAGAAGLMAARKLSRAGYAVTMLEGAGRSGRRIHTFEAPGSEQPIELGAEFVHGQLPLTFSLLKEAGLTSIPVTGRMRRVKNGQWQEQEDFTIDWDLLMRRLHELENDMTMADFLRTRFAGDEYAALRFSVQRFAEGFDVADINKVSALALREEWGHEEHEQYRIPGGYRLLVDYLVRQCTTAGVVIYHSCIVKTIHWTKDDVQVSCANGRQFRSNKLVVTVSAGVLQAGAHQTAGIAFTPAPGAYVQAMHHIGYGTVTKLLLQFKTAFWNNYAKNTGFIISEEPVGTWWTQSERSGLLTGWLGGPRAAGLDGMKDADIVQLGLRSLAGIFSKTVEELQALLVEANVANWQKDPFSMGAYSYDTIHTAAARQLLRTPLENTLFFAGEALYEGVSPGTVEAALDSGAAVAQLLLHQKDG